MEKKNKVLIIAAAGAVAILVAISIARCAISAGNAEPEGESQTPMEQAEQPEQAETSEQDTAKACMDVLSAHKWQVKDDASKTITFRDGVFIEKGGETSKVTACEIISANEASGTYSLDARITRDGSGAETLTTIVVTGSEGTYTVACDGFRNSKSYVQGSSSESPVVVSGLDDSYTALIDGKADELTQNITEWCREHVPTATEVTFDGEVFLDTKAGKVGGTFHCNDKAKTVISVTYADGKFEIAG